MSANKCLYIHADRPTRLDPPEADRGVLTFAALEKPKAAADSVEVGGGYGIQHLLARPRSGRQGRQHHPDGVVALDPVRRQAAERATSIGQCPPRLRRPGVEARV